MDILPLAQQVDPAMQKAARLLLKLAGALSEVQLKLHVAEPHYAEITNALYTTVVETAEQIQDMRQRIAYHAQKRERMAHRYILTGGKDTE